MARKPLDRETVDSYFLKISAFDQGVPRQISSAPFSLEITIEDANDNSPVFDKNEYLVKRDEATAVGSKLVTMIITDNDHAINKQFAVTISDPQMNNMFSIKKVSTSEYNLVLKKALNFEERSLYNVIVTAKDAGVPSLEKSVSVRFRNIRVSQ